MVAAMAMGVAMAMGCGRVCGHVGAVAVGTATTRTVATAVYGSRGHATNRAAVAVATTHHPRRRRGATRIVFRGRVASRGQCQQQS